MREKPVPVRVGKDIKPLETSMDEFKEEASFEKETGDSVNEDAISKELPSMVSVVPLESPNEFPSKYNTRLYQTATEYRPSSDIPGEFEFLNNESVSESQKQAVKFGVRVFRDWLNKQGVQFQSLEDMSRSEIASALEQFYLTAKRPNGTQYKKNTLKSIKHSLDHYLRASPLKKDFSISSDYDFRQVNKTLDNLPEDADQNRFPQFTKDIILKLYRSGQLGLTSTENPNILIQTVWFYIVTYCFSSIDKRLLRELKESNLVLDKDHDGREYYWLDYRPPERVRGDVDKSRIYSRPDSLCCPVAIIKKYMKHRNPRNDVLFQHPKVISHDVWYSPLPLGKNKHTDLMKSMCLNGGVEPPLTGRCIKSYVKQLLEDCDQDVNKMFRLEGPPTFNGVLLPKFPSDPDRSLGPPFILSVPQLPPPILSTSTSSGSTIRSNHVSTQPHTSTMSSNHITNHIATMVANQNTKSTTHSSHSTTTTTYYGKHLTIQGNQILTNPSGLPSLTGAYSNRFVLPYSSGFPTITEFSIPKESDDSGQTGVKGLTNGLTNAYNISKATLPYHDTNTQSSNHENGSGMGTHPGAPLQQTSPSTQELTAQESRKITADISTQTDVGNKQWLESSYHKGDLKTRNKMRLQARKSLLCFLEELNEISDGHGTELFYEIVQEDMNMWRSIAKPASSK